MRPGRLVTLKAQILDRLRQSPPRGDQARSLLGQALHTIQDFYSHSNWVELGRSGFESAVGRNFSSGGGGGRPEL